VKSFKWAERFTKPQLRDEVKKKLKNKTNSNQKNKN
jgi:hypothetical protein